MNQIINSNNITKRKSKLIPRIIIFSAILLFILITTIFIIKITKNNSSDKPSISNLSKYWKEYDYQNVYDLSKLILQTEPFNNKALTYNGYSAFFLAISQLDTGISQDLINESIISLRNALLNAKNSLVPQLEYMLGKAYFYKNTVSSYYYADLAVKYLTLAKNHGYKADDIAEYLGLSYASLGMTMESISAFTDALLVRESNTLLLSIAEQYYKAKQNKTAQQYLFRVIKNSDNEELEIKSRNLLGCIYLEENNLAEAKNEFETILSKNINFADAYYNLGNIYEKQGDLVKARAEWRKTLKIQVNHAAALSKINDYK